MANTHRSIGLLLLALSLFPLFAPELVPLLPFRGKQPGPRHLVLDTAVVDAALVYSVVRGRLLR